MDASITISGLLPGVAPKALVARTGVSGLPSLDVTLLAAKTGTLSTRTSDTAGTLTMTSGHGLTDGQVISIFWTDANGDPQFCYGATIGTVATNSVPFTGAAGTVLPDEDAAVTVDVEEAFDVDFDGDKLELLLAVGSKITGMQFTENDGTVIDATVRAAAEPYLYMTGVSQSNPLTGDPVGVIRLANGDATASNNFKLGGLYNADT